MLSGGKIPEKKCREMEKWETDGGLVKILMARTPCATKMDHFTVDLVLRMRALMVFSRSLSLAGASVNTYIYEEEGAPVRANCGRNRRLEKRGAFTSCSIIFLRSNWEPYW